MTASLRPRVMGIVNVTPDSFSDGGRFLDPRQGFVRPIHRRQGNPPVGHRQEPAVEPTIEPRVR